MTQSHALCPTIVKFRKFNAVPILELLEGYLKEDKQKEIDFLLRSDFIQPDEIVILSGWVKKHYELLDEKIDLSKYTPREIIFLGLAHRREWGVKQDDTKTLFYYNSVAEKDAHAYFWLGVMHANGGSQTKKDLGLARRYYETALSRGCLLAAEPLAILIEKTEGHCGGYSLMLAKQEIAADYGDPNGIYGKARLLHSGRCLLPDFESACFSYHKAASRGCLAALEQLGSNDNLTKEPSQAIQYLRCVAERFVPGKSQMWSKFEKNPNNPFVIYHAAIAMQDAATEDQSNALRSALYKIAKEQPELINSIREAWGDSEEVISAFIKLQLRRVLPVTTTLAQFGLYRNVTQLVLEYDAIPAEFSLPEIDSISMLSEREKINNSH